MRDWMVMLLAGRASEDLIFGEHSSGAANDLQKDCQLSRSMDDEVVERERIVEICSPARAAAGLLPG